MKNTTIASKQTKKQILFELVRFFIVSVVATLADYVTFFLLRHILADTKLSIAICTAAGFMVGLIINYFLSVLFVYKEVTDRKSTKTIRAFLIFTLIGLLGLGLTEAGMLLEHTFLPDIPVTIFNFSFDAVELAAKVILTLLVAVWNYIGRKLFIFK